MSSPFTLYDVCLPALPGDKALVLLAGEELDELPDDGLGGHLAGGP
jgi:hypothetical protein